MYKEHSHACHVSPTASMKKKDEKKAPDDVGRLPAGIAGGVKPGGALAIKDVDRWGTLNVV